MPWIARLITALIPEAATARRAASRLKPKCLRLSTCATPRDEICSARVYSFNWRAPKLKWVSCRHRSQMLPLASHVPYTRRQPGAWLDDLAA